MNTANWQKKYLGVMISRPDPADHHIALQSYAMITASPSTETVTRGRFYTNLLEQGMRTYAALKWQEDFSLLRIHASPAWTSPAMFEQTPDREIFALDWLMTVSGRALKSYQIAGKPCTLAVPSLIDLRVSTVTIHRIHVLNFSELSMYLGVAWQNVPHKMLRNLATRVHLQLGAETRGDGHTPTGNQASKPTKEQKRQKRQSQRKIR